MVTSIISGRDGIRDLARRCLRWWVPLSWYAFALLAPPAALVAAVGVLYGPVPLRSLAQHWPLLLTSYVPALVAMAVFNSLDEEAGWTGFLFARLQDRHGPMRAALVTTVCFWLFHLPGGCFAVGRARVRRRQAAQRQGHPERPARVEEMAKGQCLSPSEPVVLRSRERCREPSTGRE